MTPVCNAHINVCADRMPSRLFNMQGKGTDELRRVSSTPVATCCIPDPPPEVREFHSRGVERNVASANLVCRTSTFGAPQFASSRVAPIGALRFHQLRAWLVAVADRQAPLGRRVAACLRASQSGRARRPFCRAVRICRSRCCQRSLGLPVFPHAEHRVHKAHLRTPFFR